MKPSVIMAVAGFASAVLVHQLATPVEADETVRPGETCIWRGTAPFCEGTCEQGERLAATDEYVINYPGQIQNEPGAACVTGSKVLCCAAAPPPAVDPNWVVFCDGYATRAVASVAESKEKECGLEGPRWDPNREAHFNWCLTQQGGPQASAEELHRIRELQECKPVKPIGKVKVSRCATADVDVYDSPVEPRNVIGTMAEGAKANLVDSHEDGWSKLQGVAGGGDGWVANDHLTEC